MSTTAQKRRLRTRPCQYHQNAAWTPRRTEMSKQVPCLLYCRDVHTSAVPPITAMPASTVARLASVDFHPSCFSLSRLQVYRAVPPGDVISHSTLLAPYELSLYCTLDGTTDVCGICKNLFLTRARPSHTQTRRVLEHARTRCRKATCGDSTRMPLCPKQAITPMASGRQSLCCLSCAWLTGDSRSRLSDPYLTCRGVQCV